jgi:Arabinose efflux permease
MSRLSWSIISTYTVLKPTIQEDSLIYSLFFGGYTIVQIPAGLLSDRINPKVILLTSILSFSMIALASGLAVNVIQEIAFSFLMGLSSGWIYPASVKVISLSFSERKAYYAYGFFSLSWPLSIVLTGLIIPSISLSIGWRFNYFIMSAISLASGLLLIPEKLNFEAKRVKIKYVVNRRIILFTLSGFLFFLGYWTLVLYSYRYLILLGLSDYQSSLVYSSLAIAGIISTVLSGKILSRVGPIRSLTLSSLMYSFLFLPFIFSRNFLVLTASSLSMGFFRFLITSSISSSLYDIARENIGGAIGFSNFAWQFSAVIAPMIASSLLSLYSYQTMWIVNSFFSFSSFALFLLFERTNK